MKWIIKKEEDGMLVRDYLYSVRAFSRRMIKVVKFDGGILVNGIEVRVRHTLHSGDVLHVSFPPEERGEWLIPEQLPLEVVYEDEHTLVVEKPFGQATIPGRDHKRGTLANALMAYYDRHAYPYTAHIVTRLDRDTSGLVLIAKHRFAHSLLSEQQVNGAIHRQYYAIVTDEMEESHGTIDVPIARHPDSIIRRYVSEEGKRAVTHYKVVERKNGHTLVQLKLDTGRTHQIRVHMAYIGHPLIGDDLYGGATDKLTRQALHCFSLRYPSPLEESKHQTFEIDLAKDLKDYWKHI
ncbi:RNA pseudouridine synthase [Pontibacillus halophilus JSM 076056 = DSM 19796]|uniref:Pseudouridine synthase n=1 Tax=Pontibacillus halophilus JSM 076056 = DSM 19796 TaxID=1385510 RepID=A0A0A5IA41_9BACI|nr:RluA family pseudouridine synthase [Pontibacillus halophilus]KGX92707.1 RNA pseudouridine synthase [Pontibacillus halophilus JSM 076056 = DSM 19796]